MARYFDGRPVELLAPAGTFDIFKGVIALGCDAVYLGGKNLNMRLHRKGYNLSDEELAASVKIAHDLGKKVYITVNNLYGEQELDELKGFLTLLNDTVRPDALIVQDMSVLSLVRELGLDLALHASVMMNVHNLESIRALREQGVTRTVLSRETPLSYGKYLSAATDMELEYFIHGDMCTVHGGRCLYSGILFGQSSNRGRCLKPCRWGYEVLQGDKRYPTQFPLAAKDMCLYEHIPELIDAGITSFKIEGRMRELGYLEMLIGTYADAIDRYLDDPLCYDRHKDAPLLDRQRKRDTSTAYAFGTPGLSNINTRYEGTGALYSSGKMFSTATEERSIAPQRLAEVRSELNAHRAEGKEMPRLHVKVGSMEQAKACLGLGVDSLYLAGDIFLPNLPFSRAQIKELTAQKGDAAIYLGMPHMMFDVQFAEYRQLLREDLGLDGLLATSIGGIRAFRDLPLIGDYPLNLLNARAAGFFRSMGLGRFTITPEASLGEVISLLRQTGSEAELIVHGSPTAMYLEHDLYANVDSDQDGLLYLEDGEGFRHPVYKDQYGRNHLLLYKNLCYLPLLKELHAAGLSHFRIEGQHLSVEELVRVVTAYRAALDDLTRCEALFHALPAEAGWSLGSFALS